MTYVILANGFEEVEALTVVDMLRRAEIDVASVSINEDLTVVGAHGIKIICDISIDDVVLSDAVIIPGGIPGVPNLAADNRVVSILKYFYSNEKLVAAICAAPTLLNDIGILDNIEATCYPSMIGNLSKAKAVDERVVVSGNVITSKGPGTSFEFSYEIISYLKNSEIAENIKKSACFR